MGFFSGASHCQAHTLELIAERGVVYAQEFLRALSVEGRSAYQEWRVEGSEEGSCHGGDSNLACIAAINSLENPASVDWLEIVPCARNQSLISGEAPTLLLLFPCTDNRLERLRFDASQVECTSSQRIRSRLMSTAVMLTPQGQD